MSGEHRFGIYIHFPFCTTKCDYCDFYSLPLREAAASQQRRGQTGGPLKKEELLQEYRSALLKELQIRTGEFPSSGNTDGIPDDKTEKNAAVMANDHAERMEEGIVETIYFGGGTSSLMPPEMVEEILTEIHKRYSLAQECELTLEGNPEQFTPDYLRSLHNAGINRIHAGVQSFRTGHLASMNRSHNPQRYRTILETLSSSPISNFGIDLIYGFPHQSPEEFYGDLEMAARSGAKHLSLYSLTEEEETPYAKRVERGEIASPQESMQREIFLALPDLLESYGYQWYEVSNFARSGYHSRHNPGYWTGRPYMGLGPSAHGFNGKERYENPGDYFAWIRNPASEERTPHHPSTEIPLTLLRMTVPIPLELLCALITETLPQNGSAFEAAKEKILKLFREWESNGFGKILRNPYKTPIPLITPEQASHLSPLPAFQWTKEGVLYLDERIFEFITRMEE